MNRRNFFKVITGFMAGIFAACAPKVIGSKRSGTRKLTKEENKEFKKVISDIETKDLILRPFWCPLGREKEKNVGL